MDKLIEEKFVNGFIVKAKRERTLFELNSAKKRDQIIQRLPIYADERYEVFCDKVTEKELLAETKKYADVNKKCYVIADYSDDGKLLPFKEAAEHMLDSGSVYVIVCDNDTVLIRDEVFDSAPPVCILHKKA